jgi:hypothetical protein
MSRASGCFQNVGKKYVDSGWESAVSVFRVV